MSLKYKLFRDPVHGDIEVERWICSAFIDSDVFQRLRFVEQSSMRMLFPGARHDRFIHSLGTFLMAKRIFEALQDSIRVSFEEEQLHEFRNTFLIAALLHDCAHSPFSHTGESLANYFCESEIDKLLKCAVNDASFTNQFSRSKSATHEKASAYVACVRFKDEFSRHSINRVQLARMIIGLKNKGAENDPVLRVYNCLISLVNGFIIDVDRLDYLERDTWATGIRNASVDMERLISGLEIDFESGEIVIGNSATSSLINAVAARDYIYKWVIPHHKVAYANEVLECAMYALIRALVKKSRKSRKEVGRILFSPERLLPNGKARLAGETISLPTDGDLVYLMKKYIPSDKSFVAYSERRIVHKSLWKTHAEFMHIFNPSEKVRKLGQDFWDMFAGKVKKVCDNYGGFATNAQPIKVSMGKVAEVKFVLKDNKQKLDLTYLLGSQRQNEVVYYFNAYIGLAHADVTDKILKQLQKTFDDCVNQY